MFDAKNNEAKLIIREDLHRLCVGGPEPAPTRLGDTTTSAGTAESGGQDLTALAGDLFPGPNREHEGGLRMRTICAQSAIYLAIILGPPCDASAFDGPGEGWDAPAAGEYLDLRQKAWFESQVADRGAGETKSSCASCHTLVPYAIA